MTTLADHARSLRPSPVKAIVGGLLPFFGAVTIALVLQLLVKPWLAGMSGGDFYAKIVLDAGTAIILAVSLTIVNGFTGQFSIGHAAFMAVGAYTAACIVYYGSFRFFGAPTVHGGLISTMIVGREVPLAAWGDLHFLLAVIAGGISAALCGYLVGLPSLRLRGDYLAIVTLGFGEIIRVLIQSQTTEALAEGSSISQDHLNLIHAWAGRTTDDYMTAQEIAAVPAWIWPKYVGGALGFSGLPFYTSLFWVFLFAGITLITAFRLKNSSSGRAFLSIREDEVAAEAMGVRTTKYKIRAFVISAFFAGVGGALYAHTVGVQLSPGELGFQRSFDIIIMVVLGGLGSISGATLAAIILSILPELLRDPPSLWMWGWIVVGALAAAAFAFLPKQHKVRVTLAIVGAAVVWEGLRASAKLAGIALSDYRMVLYALMLIIMMIARPQGLFGVHEIWELWGAKSPVARRKGGAKA